MKRLSKEARLGDTFVRDILRRDRAPSIENARKLCAALGVPYGQIFMEGEDDRPVARSIEKLSVGSVVELCGTEYAMLPVYDIRFAAGAGAINDPNEDPIDHFPFSLSSLRNLTDAPLDMIAIFQSDGDSMEPTIHSRDWVFIDRRKKRLTNPGIYALVYDGDCLLKRAAQHLESGAVHLISDNQKYPAMTIKKPERLLVVGRVFLSIRRH